MSILAALRARPVFAAAASSALLFAGFGCSDDETVNILAPESGIIATVTGQVRSAPSMAVVDSATVTMLGSDAATVSDVDGVYQLGDLGLGSHRLLASSPGHASSIVHVEVSGVPDIQGILHRDLVRDIYLLETTATLSTTVRQGMNGDPAAGALAELGSWEFPGEAIDHALDPAEVPRMVLADSTGTFTVTGLPAAPVRLTVMPYDTNGDGVAEYGTSTSRLELIAGGTLATNVTLPVANGSVGIVYTNLPAYYSYYPLTDPAIQIVFSAMMDTDPLETFCQLRTNVYPYPELAIEPVWTSEISLEIPLPHGLMVEGDRYDFTVSVRSDGGIPFTDTWEFIYQEGGGGSGSCPDLVTDLALSPWTQPVDFDTGVVELSWSAVPCAGGYRLYARDDYSNDWVFLMTEPTDFESGLISTAVTLPGGFDRYDADGLQTPFAGIAVTFACVPLEAVDPDAGSGHGTVEIVDVVPPSIIGTEQIGLGDNTLGDPQILEFHLLLDEYLDLATDTPTLETREAGGDAGYLLNPADGAWHWSAGRRAGVFRFTLAPGQNASGDEFRILLQDMADLSGNVVPGESASDWIPISVAGGRFDFEGSAQGWTRSGLGWEWGSPSHGPGSAHSGTTCWAVSLHSEYGINWSGDLVSPTLRIPTAEPRLQFWSWLYTDSYSDYVRVYVDDGFTETEIVSYHGGYPEWREESISLSAFAGQDVEHIFRFTSDAYDSYAYPGFFLDDVTIESLAP